MLAHGFADRLFLNGDGVDDLEPLGNAPRDNPEAEVVDDGAQPDLSSIDQTHGGGVDVPYRVRPLGPHTPLGIPEPAAIPRLYPKSLFLASLMMATTAGCLSLRSTEIA